MSIIHEALKKAARIKRATKTTEVQKESQTLDSDNKITKINLETQPAPFKKPKKRQAALVLPITIGLMAILITTAIFLLNNYLLRKRPGVETASLNQIPKEKIPSLLTNKKIAEGNKSDARFSVVPNFEIPYHKPIQERGSLDSFVLTGIVYDKEPMAVINGSVYAEGEYVSGARITEISKQRVLIEKEGKQIELKVK